MSSQFHKEPEFDTLQLHAGQRPDPATNALAVPIYATTSFVFNNSAHGADLFGLKTEGHIYSRIGNPTVSVFEDRMAALEGGIAAVAAASGQAAQFMTISALTYPGDNIVSSSFLYGGTYNQFKVTLKKYGVGCHFVTDLKPESFAKAIDSKTRAIFIESIANPKFNVLDIAAVAKVAHDAKIPLIVDNTFGMGGWLVRPFDHGADLIVHSATKWIGGHGTTIAGVVIDGGKFDWAASGKFPGFTSPSEGYHGLIFSETFGKAAFAAKIRTEILRDVGPCMNPFSAWITIQGIETLSLRAERHSTNALAFAKWLEQHPNVDWVEYIGLPTHETHAVANRLFRPGFYGGMLTFGIKGDGPRASKLVDNLKLASNLANVGDAKTLVIHPATTTHAQLNEKEQLDAGVTPSMIRVSVGIEDIRDIIADFDAGFRIAFEK